MRKSKFLLTALVAVVCLLLLGSSDALAFGRRCRCEQGCSQQQAQRPHPVREFIRNVVGHPGAGFVQQCFVPAAGFVQPRGFVVRSSACQFGSCEGPGSACWPPADGCPSGGCQTVPGSGAFGNGPLGRIVLSAPLPIPAPCPNGKCPLPR